MADSSFETDYYSLSNQRRHYPTPVSHHSNVSGSFTASSSRSIVSSRRARRTRVPTTPFASDDDHSWQGEVSWKFEAKGWRDYSTNLGSVLSPWTASSPSDHSRVFRRTANDYYLSRTSRFRGLTNSSYEHSGFGRVELKSYVARDNDQSYIFDQHNHSIVLPKLGIIKEVSSRRGKPRSPLAEEDELSVLDYSISDEPVRRDGNDLELSYIEHDHGHYGGHHVGHGIPSHVSKSESQFYRSHGGNSHHDIDKISAYDEEGEEDMDEEDVGPPPKTVGLFSLFRYSTKWDCVLVFVGCIGALINGGSLPWYSYLFGEVVNKISGSSNNDQMLKDVEKVLLLAYSLFLYTNSNVCI